jgi:uncharacterized membrane protein
MRFRFYLLLILVASCAVLGACASGDETLEVVDPQAVDANPTYDQIFALIQNKCSQCHDSGEGEDEGDDYLVVGSSTLAADDAPALNDCTSIVAQRFEILDQVEDNLMPPGAMPRLTSEEKLKIRRWIENGAPAPCNP